MSEPRREERSDLRAMNGPGRTGKSVSATVQADLNDRFEFGPRRAESEAPEPSQSAQGCQQKIYSTQLSLRARRKSHL